MTDSLTAALDEIRDRRKLASSPDPFDSYAKTDAEVRLRQDDVLRLLAAVDSVLALHLPGGETGVDVLWCRACGTTDRLRAWPCPTHEAISSALAAKDGT